MLGTIVKIISNQYQVRVDGVNYNCIARGKLRLQGKPLVGDIVKFEKFTDQYGIEEILTRKNVLTRPAIANVDQVLIVMSAVNPEFSTTLIDRLSFLVNYNNLIASIIVTKLDLVTKEHIAYQFIEQYRGIGFQVVDVFDTQELKRLLANKISVLTGQSGVGKSTCLNRLNPEFALVTQEISKALNRGKHTTRFTCLYPVGEGLVADTPGFSALTWQGIDLQLFSQCLQDWQHLNKQCYYRDCIHLNEPNCQIKAAVANREIPEFRYTHYRECIKLIQGDK